MLKTALAALALVLPAAFVPQARAQAQTLQTVNFAWSANPQTPQVDVAVKNGLFKEAGLDVKLVAFPTGREALEALLGGQVDFAFMAEFPAATAVLRNQPLKVVADLSRYNGQRLIASAKRVDLKTVQDLAGHKIGTTLGTNVEFALDRMLTGASVKATIVNAGPADLVPALVSGDVDAAMMFPTFFPAAKRSLGADYRDMLVPNYQVHQIIAASADVTQKRPAIVEKFVGALVKADAAVASDPKAAQEDIAANLHGGMNAAAVAQMWPDFDFSVRLDRSLLSLLTEEGVWIVGRGMVKVEKPTEATFRPYLDGTALKAVAPNRVDLP